MLASYYGDLGASQLHEDARCAQNEAQVVLTEKRSDGGQSESAAYADISSGRFSRVGARVRIRAAHFAFLEDALKDT
jgi:hypothetical protein